MIYIYTLCKPSVWFSKLRTPKKGICVQSHSTVMSCSSMEWSGDSMGDNQHMMVGESWILCFFCGSLPSSMVSSLPTFLHLYGLYIHSCCQLKPQVVITLSRWKFDFCPQLQFFDSNLTAGPSVCHPRYGPLPVISAYNPIYGMYNPIEMNQFLVIICYNHLYVVFRAITARNIPRATSVTFAQRTLAPF